MTRLVRALSALLLCLAATGAQASLWYGDTQGLHRVATGTNTTDLHAASAEPVALAIDPNDGAVWSVSRTRVAKLTKDGVVVFNRTLASYAANIGEGRSVAVSQPDGAVWLGGERRVVHLARDGTLLSVLEGGGSTDLKIAPDDSVWVLDTDRDELRHYNYDGSPIFTVNLGGASRRARFLAIDAAYEYLWLGGDHALIKRSTNSPSAILRTVETSHEVNAISLDPERGELWVLGDNSFHGYRANGTHFMSENLGNDGVNDPETLVFDFDTQALWIGHRRGVSRFTRAGNRVAALPAGETGTIAASRQAMYFVPGILPASLFGATVKDTRPVIAFLYNATCSGNNCPFPPAFYATHSIVADLDGVNISSQFVFDPATGETRYRPPAPLADGFHRVTARAVDADGRVSEPAQLWFTVDTTGPTLVALSPPSGGSFTTPTITVSGSFDPSATVVSFTGLSTIPGNAFHYELTFQVFGTSTFTLAAMDELGNITTIPVTYTYNPPNAPPIVSIVVPGAGQVFTTAPATFQVFAEASDPDGTVASVEFFLDNVSIGSTSIIPYRADVVDLPAGNHTFYARVTDNRGLVRQSASVPVRVNAPPTVTLLSPTDGAVVWGGITLHATMGDADGSIRLIELLRDGETAFFLPYMGPEMTLPFGGPSGTYAYALRVTDNNGVSTTSAAATTTVREVNLQIQSPAPGATVTAGNISVTGVFKGPPTTSMTVNGIAATLVFDGNPNGSGTFYAVVPLPVGAAQVIVELSSPELTFSMGSSVFVTVVP